MASFDHCRVLEIACLERDCPGVNSRCGLLLSMRMLFVLVRLGQTVMICIDLGFSWALELLNIILMGIKASTGGIRK